MNDNSACLVATFRLLVKKIGGTHTIYNNKFDRLKVAPSRCIHTDMCECIGKELPYNEIDLESKGIKINTVQLRV